MTPLIEIYQEAFPGIHSQIPSPCFVLDEKSLIGNLEKLKAVRDSAGVELICALKGFALHDSFQLIGKYLSGGSASSLNEARLVYEKMGIKAHTYCPVYNPSEIDRILSISRAVTFNSIGELNRYGGRALEQGVSVGIRVNPGYSEITTKLYDPADPASRLGVGPEVLQGGLPDGVDGLHFHVLCENDSHTLERVLQSLETGFGHVLSACKWVNFGGGHLITRKGYDTDHLIGILKEFKERYDVEVILEPGSAIAWETGCPVSTVLDIVENGGKRTAMLNVSFTCHMPDCLEMPYKPDVVGESVRGIEYSLGGMSCLAGDHMDGFRFDEPLNIGERIIFKDMMHYTMVKTTTFNGVNLPAIAVFKTNGSLSVIRRFGYQDYKDRLS